MERRMTVEPNSMQCSTPEALRFLASTAKTAEAHWMNKAAEEIERRWIPVSERLPEHDTNVLIAVGRKDGEVVVKEVLFVDWSLPHEPADPRFSDDYGGEDLKDVSHWMPLPEPPVCDAGKQAEAGN